MARIAASFSTVAFIALGVLCAMIIAAFIPGLDPAKMGAFDWKAYAHTFVFYTLPNLALVGAIVVAVVLHFRNIYSAFAASLIPFILQSILENAFTGDHIIIALSDPFGQNTLAYFTHHWSILERNQSDLPVGGLILYNRVLWLSIAGLLLYFSVRSFKLHEYASDYFLIKRGRSKRPNPSKPSQSGFALSHVKLSLGRFHQIKALWVLSGNEFKYIIKNPAFIVISALAVLAMIFAINRVTQSGEMILLPLTRVILMVPTAFYTIICMLLIFVLSGLLITREKTSRVSQMMDTTPTPFGIFWGSKLVAMIQVEILLMLVFIVTGTAMQTVLGYYHYEIGLYCYHLFFFVLIPLAIWTAAAFIVHTIIDNVYVGLFVLVFGWVGLEGLPQIGLESALIRFNNLRPVTYSDMNGYGVSEIGFFWIEAYWLSFAILLTIITHLMWRHGIAFSIWNRLRKSYKRLSMTVLSILIVTILCMVVTGFVIYKGEKEKLDFSKNSLNDSLKLFKEKFGYLESTPSLKIRSLEATIDLYPEEQRFEASGSYQIENPWDTPIHLLLVKTGFDEETDFELDVAYEEIDTEPFLKFHLIKLKKALRKGENITMNFTIKSIPNSLFQRNSNVLENGTFLKHDIFPRLGYRFSDQMSLPLDSVSRLYHYQGIDADLIDLSLTIGTAAGQIALAPGRLTKQWREDDRNYYVYKTERPVKFSFGINSGQYNHSADTICGKVLEVYSHHTSNLSTLYSSVRSTFTFLNNYFEAYKFPNLRIIEFPDSEGSYSTAFANNLPMSEIRFVSNPDPSRKKINLSFYVPSHELIHHWWGSTLIPARAKGATMLTESVTEYLTLHVYESYYGEHAAEDFLRRQHQRYWNGHNKATKKESPLYLVETSQQFVSYGKGTVVFNGLSHLIGKVAFNKILAGFLEEYQTDRPPYPTSIDFIDYLKESTADSIHTFIENQFQSVSYFDNKIESTALHQKENGSFQVSIKIRSKKWLLDPTDPSRQPLRGTLNDWLQIGCYNDADELVSTEWIHLDSATMNVSIELNEKVKKIALDPNLLLLEKNREDNAEMIETY